MKTNIEITKIIKLYWKYLQKEKLTDLDFINLITEFYILFDKIIRGFLKLKTELTIEDYREASEIIIDMHDLFITYFCWYYSGDNSSAPYQISSQKLSKLKETYAKHLTKQNAIFDEIFIVMLLAMYTPCFNNAHKFKTNKK